MNLINAGCKKILLLFLVCGFICQPINFCRAETAKEKAAEYYQTGIEYYEQGNYKEAQLQFQKALDILGKTEQTAQQEISDDSEIDNLLGAEETRINLNYKDVPFSTVIKSFAATYDLNIVIPQDAAGKVTLSLKDVSIDEALDAILISAGYSYYKKGSLIYVYPLAGVEESSLVTVSVALKYLVADEAESLIAKSLSAKGDLRVNEANNSVVIRDYPPIIEKIQALLKEIDIPPLQVLIEAKIVDITSQDLRNIGIKYNPKYSAPGGLFYHAESNYTGSDEVEATVDMEGPSSSLSGGQFVLDSFIIKNWTGDATLDALIQDQRAHLLASPSIATLNGKEARIVIGEKVPYKEKTQTTTGTTETVKFIDVGTTLKVTPQISPDGYITMSVHPEVSSVSSFIDNNPRITTREADVVVRVKDGDTLVIGGLIKNEDTRVDGRIPILGSIPIVNLIFSNKSKDASQTELAVFITPYIIRDGSEFASEIPMCEDPYYVNIAGVGDRVVANTMFTKARHLEKNSDLESRQKDKNTRMAEALELYKTIAFQFPRSDKADRALYRAGKIYYWFYRDEEKAKDMFEALVKKFPDSRYYKDSLSIVKSLERRKQKRKQ